MEEIYDYNEKWYVEVTSLNVSICKNTLIKEAALRITPFLVFIGVFLNTLTIIIFSRKKLRKFVISIVMISLSLADSGVLLIPIFITWFDEFFNDFKLLTQTVWCSLHGYFDIVFCFMSAWITILISVERWLAVHKPWKKTKLFTKTRTILTILCLFIFACILAIFFPLTVKTSSNQNREFVCDKNNKTMYVTFGFISISLIYFVPFIILAVLNTKTIWALQKRPFKRRNSIQFEAHQPQLTVILHSHSSDNMKRQLSPQTKCQPMVLCYAKNDRNLTVTLLAVGITYMVLTFPYQLYWVNHMLNDVIEYDTDLEMMCLQKRNRIIFFEMTFMFRNLNYVINFVLYSLLSKLFRDEFFEVACNIIKHIARSSSKSKSSKETEVKLNPPLAIEAIALKIKPIV